MRRKKTLLLTICLYLLSGVSIATAGEPPRDTAQSPLHFVEAVKEAMLRMAVVEPFCDTQQQPMPVATGVFVTEDGGVITSIAAVAGAKEIFVKRLHEERLSARIKAVDQTLGFVFLQTPISVETPIGTASGSSEPGEWVLVTYATDTQTEGKHEMDIFPAVISSTEATARFSGRDFDSMIKLAAAAPKGSAAAPVFNSRGLLEGVLVATRECSKTSDCSYVLHADELQKVVENLKAGRSNRLGWIGIAIRTLPGRDAGVEVAAVMRGCPADEAGIEAGDIILSINERRITGPAALKAVIGEFPPGQKVELKIRREGELEKFDLTLDPRPLSISTPCPVKRDDDSRD